MKQSKLLFFIIFILLLLVPSMVSAQYIHSYESYYVDVDIADDYVFYELSGTIEFAGTENIHEFIITPDAVEVEIYLNGDLISCDVSKMVGKTLISCDMSIALTGKNYISINYRSHYSYFNLGDKDMFSDVLDFGGNVSDFKLSIKLPMGSVLPERSDLFVKPLPDDIYSDGRRHILSWDRENISRFGVSVIYESSKESGLLQNLSEFAYLLFIILIFVFVVYGFYMYKKSGKEKKYDRDLVYSHLLESEMAIVDALSANMSVLKQKELQNITSFSKAKLSRVISNLESRGIIEKKPWGNSNKIFLLKPDEIKKENPVKD